MKRKRNVEKEIEKEAMTNVELLKILRSSGESTQRKIALAFRYLDGLSDTRGISVPMPQFIGFLAEWVQTAIISASKSQKTDENSALDGRSWRILDWCMSRQSVHVSPGILRGIEYAFTAHNEKNGTQLLEAMSSVLERLTSSYTRTFRPQLFDWVTLVASSLDLVLRQARETALRQLGEGQCLLFKVWNLIATAFTSFLTTHSNPKTSFQVTVEKLVDPLLSLLGLVLAQDLGGDRRIQEAVFGLQYSIERLLENGLFHTSYLEGFPYVCAVLKSLQDSRPEGLEEVVSNHRQLFDKLKQLREKKNFSALSALSSVLRLFIRRFKTHSASVNEDIFGVRGSSQKQEQLDQNEDVDEEMQMKKPKQLTDDQRLFLVFAEFTSPLIQELRKILDSGTFQACNCVTLLESVNRLFLVAKEEEIYVPTRDQDQEQLKFIKQFYLVLVSYVEVVSANWACEKEQERPAFAGLRHVVCGVSYVLDMEHRATEDKCASLWPILLSAASVEISHGKSERLAEVIGCGCKILHVASELRNLGSMRLLFESVRDVLVMKSVSSGLLFLPSESYGAAMNKLLCSEAILEAIKKAMEVLPEGQSAEIVDMISTDASETLSLLRDCQRYSANITTVVSALSQLYGHALEELHVTVTNAAQIASHVEKFVNSVLAGPLSELLDELSLQSGKLKIKRSKARWTMLKGFYLLRLFLVYRTLHRHCMSLMPPLKAKKAKAATREVSAESVDLDWLQIASERKAIGIFSWVERPEATVTDVFDGLTVLGQRAGGVPPTVHHVMDLLIVHRLDDLRRYICSVEYHERKAVACTSQADPVMISEAADRVDGCSTMLRGLLDNFRGEAKKLASCLLEGFGTCSILQMDTDCERWNQVIASLTEETLPCARRLLLSRSFDLWSKYVSKKKLRIYVSRVLDSWRVHGATGIVSDELLTNLMFYEDQRVQGVLLQAFYKTLEKTLGFEMDGNAESTGLTDVKVGCSLLPSHNIQKSLDLFHLSTTFPRRMQTGNQHASFICFAERFVLAHLKSATRGNSIDYVLKLLELFAACRSALQAASISYDEDTASVLASLQWLYRSIDIASECVQKTEETMFQDKDKMALQRLLLTSVFKSTNYFITINLKNITQGTRELVLESTSDGNRRPNTENKTGYAKLLLSFVAKQMKSASKLNQDPTPTLTQTCKILGAVSAISSVVWNITTDLENLDKECQAEKDRGLKWSTRIPELWLSFMQEVELLILPMLFKEFTRSEGKSTNSILDVYLGSEVEPQSDPMEVEEEEDEMESQDLNRADEEIVDDNEEEDEDEVVAMIQEEEVGDDKKMETEAGSCFQVLVAPVQAAFKRQFVSENREQAEVVGEAFMAVAALVRLRSLYFSPYAAKASPIKQAAAPSLNTLLELLYWFFKEAATTCISSASFDFPNSSWLFGAIKCMEATGYLLPSLKPALSSLDFSKLVSVHIELLGAIVDASRREERQLHEADWSSSFKVDKLQFFVDLKNAIKDSFGALLRHAPRENLLQALKTIQKSIYASAASDSLCESGVIAAGVECLAVSLDAVSGPWRLKLLANYSPSFVASLMLLIRRLEQPKVYIESEESSVAVIIRCLEILSKLSSRDVIFAMKPNHVALALHCPSSLLRPLYKLEQAKDSWIRTVDGESTVKLYVACCKLLYSTLRHRTRESGRCIAILAESLRVLLYCLEAASESKEAPWNITMAVECSHWLRRVYEELGEHKETLSRYCNHVIADYLVVLSGAGPASSGLSREVDKQIRPGIYALVEACSDVDLQQLYAALGDGPLRNNLNMLRQDFEKNFKYTGKI